MNNEEQIKRYACNWPGCNHVFDVRVGKGYGEKTNPCSTQVVCPNCGNGLRTWEDGIELGKVKLMKERMVSR